MKTSSDTTLRRSAKALTRLIAPPIAAAAIAMPTAALAQQAFIANGAVVIPAVRVGNVDFPNVTLGLIPHPTTFAFRVTGAGQPVPTSGTTTNVFDGSKLSIGSVVVGNEVYTNVLLNLTNPQTFDFELFGLTPPVMPPLAAPTALDGAPQIGDPFWPNGNTPTGGQGQPVAGMGCGNAPINYHVHSHLSIVMNGRQLAIPSSVGLMPSCFYALHTHDQTGKLHVETDAPFHATLGQLFQIWGQPLSPTNVAGITGLPMAVYVTDNGIVRRFIGDPNTIPLTSRRQVTIQLGSPPAAIPNYTWPGQ